MTSGGLVSQSCANLAFGDPSTCNADGIQFTGQYHDNATGLDSFKARYDSPVTGQFMSPGSGAPSAPARWGGGPAGLAAVDPNNPQTWNRYAYALNEPTSYVDPDGRDAIAVDFTNMAYGFGHEGIVVLRADGTAEYARFGPVPAGSATGQGQVLTYNLGIIQLGPDGTPTPAAFQSIAQAVASFEHLPDASTVRMNYFATAPQGTAALDNYIAQTKAESDAGKLPNYNVLKCNCANYAVGGLYASGAVGNSGFSMMPNELYDQLVILALENWANGALQPAQKACVEWDDQYGHEKSCK